MIDGNLGNRCQVINIYIDLQQNHCYWSWLQVYLFTSLIMRKIVVDLEYSKGCVVWEYESAESNEWLHLAHMIIFYNFLFMKIGQWDPVVSKFSVM